MRTFTPGVLGALLAAMAVAWQPAKAQVTSVDLELVLAVDVSGSVSTSEFNLQKQGYVDAFDSAAVQAAIDDGTLGQIAAALVYWSSDTSQVVAVDWQLVDEGTGGISASDFADLIDATSRPFTGQTGVAAAMNFSRGEIGTNAFEGTRKVIDISGDGIENEGGDPAAERDAAEAAGVTINGLPIVIASNPALVAFYSSQVQTSDGFTLVANGFEDFGNAAQRKITAEIGGEDPTVPVPATIMLFGGGLLALGIASRRRRRGATAN